MRGAWLVACLVQLGCNQLLGLEAPEPFPSDAATATPDADVCLDLSSACASVDVLRTCTSVGSKPVDEICAWGCSEDDEAHCMALQPSGGVIDAAALSPNPALADITIAGAATLDTITGSITGVRAAGEGIDSGIELTLTTAAAVFRVRSLTITGPLLLRGNRSAVIVSTGAVDIRALVDVRGTCVGSESGPGGFRGGLAGAPAAGSGGGGGGGNGDQRAGGGGGHGSAGARGGYASSLGAAPGGVAFGDAAITVLLGGGGGGSGGDPNDGGPGGGGGGALQIVSNTSVTIATAGVINAGGCGGHPSSGTDSAGGGGAGGTVLIEAPSVTIAGTIAVNGGGGGAGRGGRGAPGSASTMPAAGGVPDNSGAGGTGAAGGLPATEGLTSEEAGGGGGGIGRIRINTRSGAVSLMLGLVMSPSFDDVPTTATSGTATAR